MTPEKRQVFEALQEKLGGWGQRPNGSLLHSFELGTRIEPGLISQFSGNGKTELMMRILAQNPEGDIAWIEPRRTIYPLAIVQRNLELKRFLFLESDRALEWTTLQVLNSGLFRVVVVSADLDSDLNELKRVRRYQLAAEKSNASVFFLSSYFSDCWPVAVQASVVRGEFGALKTEIHRRKGMSIAGNV